MGLDPTTEPSAVAPADANELAQTLFDIAPSEVFDFERITPDGTRKRVPIRVKLLRVEENHQAILAAQRYAKERGELREYGDIYREGQACEVLWRALCHVEKRTVPSGHDYYPPLFTSAKQLRESFTEPEMVLGLNCYEIVKARFGVLENFSEEQLDLWVSRLSEVMAGPYFFARLDSSAQLELALALALRVRSLYAELGRTLPDWQQDSASDSETSPSGTGDSTGPVSALSSDGSETPSSAEGVSSREAARGWQAKRARATK